MSKGKKKGQSRRLALILGILGGVALVVIAIVVLVVVIGGGNFPGLPARDPKFDQIQKGMTEAEVLELLSAHAYTYTPKAVGIWTYPRRTLEEHLQDPSRNTEIQDVIFVYFREGNVDNIYRVTGEEFRKPRPRSR